MVWDLVWRTDFRFDVVTFLGPRMAEAIEERMKRESLPFSNCFSETTDSLAKRLAFMPDVKYVVHNDPDRLLAYGNRGLLVTDPGALNLW